MASIVAFAAAVSGSVAIRFRCRARSAYLAKSSLISRRHFAKPKARDSGHFYKKDHHVA